MIQRINWAPLDELIRQMWAKRASGGTIALALNRLQSEQVVSASNVLGRARVLGLPERPKHSRAANLNAILTGPRAAFFGGAGARPKRGRI